MYSAKFNQFNALTRAAETGIQAPAGGRAARGRNEKMSKKKQRARPPRQLGPYTDIGLRLELTEPQLARLNELHPDLFDIVLGGVKVADDQLNSLVDLIAGLAADQATRDMIDAGLI